MTTRGKFCWAGNVGYIKPQKKIVFRGRGVNTYIYICINKKHIILHN